MKSFPFLLLSLLLLANLIDAHLPVHGSEQNVASDNICPDGFFICGNDCCPIGKHCRSFAGAMFCLP